MSEDTKKADAALNSFSFQFATSELNRIGSIGSIAYDNGKVNIKGVPFNELLKKSSVDTVEDLAARKRALKAAKNAYENSEEVRQLKAARENAKRTSPSGPAARRRSTALRWKTDSRST